MSDILERLYAETVRIAQSGVVEDADQLELLLQLRQEAIDELSSLAEIPTEQKQLIDKIRTYDDVIIHLMTASREEASKALEKINQSRVQKDRYESQYDAESYFIDKRK